MYAYCLNNPIMGYDPYGKWTFSVGWSFSAFLIGGSTYSVSLAFDSYGNIALQTAKADVFSNGDGGTFGVASIGIAKSYSYTSLETVDDLNGQALNTGGSVPVYGPISVGGEVISSLDNPTSIVGGDVSLGVGVGIDIHTTASSTETVGKFNFVESAKNIWDKFINWIGG